MALSALVLSVAPAAMAAGAAQAQSPPTTIEVEESTVEREVTVTSLDVEELTTDDDDDGNAGLWGLLGLLGLLGLAGLAGRRRRDDDVTRRSGVQADTTPRGSTTHND